MATYGVGLDQHTGEYTVIIDSRRTRSFPTCHAALAYIDEHRETQRTLRTLAAATRPR
jgi:hypothetical protein